MPWSLNILSVWFLFQKPLYFFLSSFNKRVGFLKGAIEVYNATTLGLVSFAPLCVIQILIPGQNKDSTQILCNQHKHSFKIYILIVRAKMGRTILSWCCCPCILAVSENGCCQAGTTLSGGCCEDLCAKASSGSRSSLFLITETVQPQCFCNVISHYTKHQLPGCHWLSLSPYFFFRKHC